MVRSRPGRHQLFVLASTLAACSGPSAAPPPPTTPVVAVAAADAGGAPSAPEALPYVPASPLGTGTPRPIGACASGRGDTGSFTIVHVNDLQARYSDRDAAGKSRYARISGFMRAVKDEVPATLVLDAGDDYEKGSLVDLRTAGAATRRILHALPLDVRTLGNHDFAYGEAAVRADVRESPHVVLSANVRDPSDPTLFRSFVKLDVGCVRVGVLGLVTQPYGSDDEQKVGASYGTFTHDPRVVKIASGIVDKYRGEVDVMIALTHLGKGTDTYLAHEVSGLDFVIGGHSEDTIEKPLRVPQSGGGSALVLQTGHFGEAVGRADVVVRFADKKVDVERYRLVQTSEIAPVDDALDREIARLEREHVPGLNAPVGIVAKERGAADLAVMLANAARDALGAEAVLVGKDAFWGKLGSGPVTLQKLYELVLVQKQPIGTPGFTALSVVEMPYESFEKLGKALRKNGRFVLEVPRQDGAPVPPTRTKSPVRVAVEKRVLEHPEVATWPPFRFGAKAAAPIELIDLFERYARALAQRGAPLDDALL